MRIHHLLLLATFIVATPRSTRAETVTASLTFTDGDLSTKPLVEATVEVWRYRPGVSWFGGWGWAMDMTTFTDASGNLSVPMPFVGNGVTYALRVYATNSAARVYATDSTQPFYSTPGSPGAEIRRVTTSAGNVHDFSFQFTDGWARNHFNVADALLRGYRYAEARRDPRETDTLGQVNVNMSTLNSTFYDPVIKAMRLNTQYALDDYTVLHEYAHYLEERISSFVGTPAVHDGCTAFIGSVDVMEPGYAWMEGFASYFAQAVAKSLPDGVINGNMAGTIGPGGLEFPMCPPNRPRAAQEVYVGAALYDLMDLTAEGSFFGPYDPLPTGTDSDNFCSSMFPADTIIFQIFDHELDNGWTNPSLQQFADAWSARGLDVPMLQRNLGLHDIVLAMPAPAPRYDMNPAANVAVFRPIGSFNSQWWIAGGLWGLTDWGRIGDRPVPADYDGDGLTDIAVWRPSDGNWYVVSSGSNAVSVTQWGMAGDIPLPGDYDGDNEIDFAVYRPSTQIVYVHSDGCGFHREIWVGPGTPVVGDFDGDGIDEPGSYYPPTSHFFVQLATGAQLHKTMAVTDGTPVPRDYDGDGVTDFAIFKSNTAWWYFTLSTDNGTYARPWGLPGDVPVPADYDGEGAVDMAVWTPSNGHWKILTQDFTRIDEYWGQVGDVPVPAR